MEEVTSQFASQYASALQAYLGGAGEAALRQAYDLGRQSLEYESGVLLIAAAHHQALKTLLPEGSLKSNAQVISRAADFFQECLSAIEMAQRGFQDSIASLRNLNEALQRQQRDLRLLLSPIPDLLLTIDERNRLAAFFVPPHFPRILKAYEEGMPLADVLPDEIGPSVMAALTQVRQSKDILRIECPLVSNGHTLYFDLQILPVADSGDVLLMVDHITGRKEIQLALYQQGQDMAALNERQRLARDLHDAVSQSLFSASIIAESLPRLWEQNPNKVFPNLNQLHQLIKSASAEMRILLWELRPANLVGTTLDELLAQLVNAVQSRTKIVIQCQVEGKPKLPDDVHLTFYRIAQESLNNIIKHSQATEAQIELSRRAERSILRVRDNGRGFSTRAVSSGLGLSSMHERAQLVNASFDIVSEPGQGTEITLTWAEAV
jgi:signal transduction histidine kinase